MSDSIIMLDVGGKIFQTHVSTLTKYPESMLGVMFNHTENGMAPMPKTKDGHYFLDVDPTYFQEILNFLRHGEVITQNPDILRGVKSLANFFGLTDLLEKIGNYESDLQWVTLNLQGKKEIQIPMQALTKSLSFTNIRTKTEPSILSKYFLGNKDAKEKLWIRKESENSFYIARPAIPCEYLFNLLQGEKIFVPDKEVDSLRHELRLFGIAYSSSVIPSRNQNYRYYVFTLL